MPAVPQDPSAPLPWLTANLAALAATRPELATRLAGAAGDDTHVRFSDAGNLILRWRQHDLPLDLEPAEREALLHGSASGPGLLVGVGAGDLLPPLLDRQAPHPLTAWDRDPTLLLAALGRHDLRAPLAQGRLQLALGADLLTLAEPPAERFRHPRLAPLYHREESALDRGLAPRRVLLATGELFVDDLADALTRSGWQVYPLDLAALSAAELAHTVRAFSPAVLFVINYRHGLAEFCHSLDLPLVCWEIDPVSDRLPPCAVPPARTRIFTYRKCQVDLFRQAGFPTVEWLPLAANPRRRRPQPPREGSAPLVFVGASMVEQALRNRARLAKLYDRFTGWGAEAETECRDRLGRLLDAQRRQPDTYLVPRLLAAHLPGLAEAAAAAGEPDDVEALIAEIAAAERRLSVVAGLGGLGVEVWGDRGWTLATTPGVRYRGPADHGEELNTIYSQAGVVIDIGRLYQPDIVTMRVFDVLACGGFVLAEWSDDLAELFHIGVEVEAWRGQAELRNKAAWYLNHPQAAQAIAQRGRQAVLRRHTFDRRLRRMLSGGFPPPSVPGDSPRAP